MSKHNNKFCGVVDVHSDNNSVTSSVQVEDILEASDDSVFKALSDSLPWVISILAHVAIFLVLLFVMLFEPVPARVAKPTGLGKMSAVNMSIKQSRSFRKKTNEAKKSSSVAPSSNSNSSSIQSSASLSDTNVNVVGKLGSGGGKRRGPRGITNSKDNGTGIKVIFDSGDNLSPENTIFLMDISGSMQGSIGKVKNELYKSIARLNSSQTFSVIFFAEGEPKVLSNWSKLKYASDINKGNAAKFINKAQAAGQTNAVKAISKAFKVYNNSKKHLKKGTVIYLLTDGEFENSDKVIKKVQEMIRSNPDVAICTFLYCDSEEEEADAADVLKKIAEITGGSYKYVPAE